VIDMELNNLVIFLISWIGAIGLNVLLFTYLSARFNTPSFLISGIASYIILANVLAYKIIQIGYFVVPAGVVAYSMIFLIGDILSEKYGKRYAQHGVYAGFLMNIMFVVMIYLAIISPPLSSDEGIKMHENFAKMFSLTSRIILGSLIAFIISQTFNVFMFHMLKEKTKGKFLWLRNNLSTMLAQFIDTVLFISISFYGVLPINVVYNMILTQYLMKIIIALLDTPFIYAGVILHDKFSQPPPKRKTPRKNKRK